MVEVPPVSRPGGIGTQKVAFTVRIRPSFPNRRSARSRAWGWQCEWYACLTTVDMAFRLSLRESAHFDAPESPTFAANVRGPGPTCVAAGSRRRKASSPASPSGLPMLIKTAHRPTPKRNARHTDPFCAASHCAANSLNHAAAANRALRRQCSGGRLLCTSDQSRTSPSSLHRPDAVPRPRGTLAFGAA